MARIPTSLVRTRHAYTGVDLPWEMDCGDGDGSSPLLRLLRGGGIRAFSNPSSRSLLLRRQRRFLRVFAAGAVAWLLFWIF